MATHYGQIVEMITRGNGLGLIRRPVSDSRPDAIRRFNCARAKAWLVWVDVGTWVYEPLFRNHKEFVRGARAR